MTPGRSIIRRCTSCDGAIKQRTLNSGNTFGAQFWTDGKRDAPMLPHYPLLVRCPHCNKLLWMPSLPKDESFENEESYCDSEQVRGIFDPVKPAEKDFLEALQTGVAGDVETERYLRVNGWFAANDIIRDNALAKDNSHLSNDAQNNMKQLSKMLDVQNPNDRLMKAEIARELGDFVDCCTLLDFPFEEGFAPAVSTIKLLAEQRNSHVAKLKFD